VLQDSARLWSEVFANTATGFGIIVAGIWAYLRFIRQRDKFPKAELAHRVESHRVSKDRLSRRLPSNRLFWYHTDLPGAGT
jgi:hypothetical protein